MPILVGIAPVKAVFRLSSSAVGNGDPLSSDILSLAEGNMRPPLRALAGRDALSVHLINLLETEALSLVDVEEDEGDAEEAGTKPDEEDLALQVGIALAVVDKVGGRVGNGPVEKPLGRGAQISDWFFSYALLSIKGRGRGTDMMSVA